MGYGKTDLSSAWRCARPTLTRSPVRNLLRRLRPRTRRPSKSASTAWLVHARASWTNSTRWTCMCTSSTTRSGWRMCHPVLSQKCRRNPEGCVAAVPAVTNSGREMHSTMQSRGFERSKKRKINFPRLFKKTLKNANSLCLPQRVDDSWQTNT